MASSPSFSAREVAFVRDYLSKWRRADEEADQLWSAAVRRTYPRCILNLPTELREKIYTYVFREAARVEVTKYGCASLTRVNWSHRVCSAITQTCRKIRLESLPMLQGLSVKLDIHAPYVSTFDPSETIPAFLLENTAEVSVSAYSTSNSGFLSDALPRLKILQIALRPEHVCDDGQLSARGLQHWERLLEQKATELKASVSRIGWMQKIIARDPEHVMILYSIEFGGRYSDCYMSATIDAREGVIVEQETRF